MKLDKKDIQILRILQQNSRVSLKKLARKTSLPVTTVFNRIKKFEQNGLIKDDLKILYRELRVPKKPFKIYTTHELEEKYGEDWEIKASLDSKEPFWVVCHKREFYDKEDPERPGHYLNYDLIWPEGFGEGLSGSEREYEHEKIIRKIRRNGLNEKQYEQYLKIAKAGLLKPSAGAGMGIERFVRYVTGRKHIIEVQPFIRAPGKPVIL